MASVYEYVVAGFLLTFANDVATAISMALVSSYTIPLLLELNKAGKIKTEDLITHGKFERALKISRIQQS